MTKSDDEISYEWLVEKHHEIEDRLAHRFCLELDEETVRALNAREERLRNERIQRCLDRQ